MVLKVYDYIQKQDVLHRHRWDIISITASITLSDEEMVFCDATSGNITVTLPVATLNTGRMYRIKKTDSSGNTVTVDGNSSETIDGGTTATISNQFEAITIMCDGSNWHII